MPLCLDDGDHVRSLQAETTFSTRGVSFEDAAIVFAGMTFTFEDHRNAYGEQRFLTIGRLNGRMMAVGWTPRGAHRHVFSMRKTNDREQKNTARFSASDTSKQRPLSDMVRVDAHVIQPDEYDEIPGLADLDLATGVLEIAGQTIRRGRPPKDKPKKSTTLRLDVDVIAHFKADGPGWQSRINSTLRRSIRRRHRPATDVAGQ